MKRSRPNVLPRWRGFNLQYFFSGKSDCTPVEDDFKWIADWGFDFIRLPMNYRLWTEEGGPRSLRDDVLQNIDGAAELDKKLLDLLQKY